MPASQTGYILELLLRIGSRPVRWAIGRVAVRFFWRYPLLLASLLLSLTVIAILCAMFPWKKIKVGVLVTERLGHLALNTDLFARRRQLGLVARDAFYVFLAGQPANRQLLTMWKRELFIVESLILKGAVDRTLWLWKRTPFHEPLAMYSNEHREYKSTEPVLRFTAEEEKRGESYLRSVGIDPGRDWFVCVFARDSEYLGREIDGKADWSYHDFRNADIDTFVPAIRFIIESGGYVLRLGYRVAKSLSYQHERLIDYAVRDRTDFLDIYLPAHCRFLLGTTSGICDISMIFDRPRIGTNWVPFGNAPWGKHCLHIPKLLRRRETGQLLSFEEQAKLTMARFSSWVWDGRVAMRTGLEYCDNTPHDILDITKEMLERLEGRHQDDAETESLRRAYHALLAQHWSSEIETPIGRDFLLRHSKLLPQGRPA